MPQQPNITGLSALGEALQQGGRDYMQITLAQRARDENRANQLRDVADSRAYSEAQGQRARSEHLQDAQTMATMQARMAGLQVMRNEGLLPVDRDPTPEEFAAASKTFADMGLDKLYAELLTTPGPEGTPLLSQADKTDPAKVAAAKQALGGIKSKQMQFTMGQQGNAQDTVNSFAGQLAEQRAANQQLSRKLNDGPRRYQANDPEVQQYASLAAEQHKAGSGMNREAVAKEIPGIIAELNGQALQEHVLERQNVAAQLAAGKASEASLTSALDHAIQVSRVFPTKGAAAPASILQAPTVSAPQQTASPEQIAAAMRAALGGGAGGPPPAPGAIVVPTNADPETQQLITQANQEKARYARETLIGPLDQEEAQLQQKIAAVKTIPATSPRGMPIDSELGFLGMQPGVEDNTAQKAKQLAQLYLQLKDVQDKRKTIQSQALGVPAGNMMTPQIAPPSASVLVNPAPSFVAPNRPIFSAPPLLQSGPNWFAAPAGG